MVLLEEALNLKKNAAQRETRSTLRFGGEFCVQGVLCL